MVWCGSVVIFPLLARSLTVRGGEWRGGGGWSVLERLVLEGRDQGGGNKQIRTPTQVHHDSPSLLLINGLGNQRPPALGLLRTPALF